MSLDPQLLLKLTRKTGRFFNEISDMIEDHIKNQGNGPVKPINQQNHAVHNKEPETHKEYAYKANENKYTEQNREKVRHEPEEKININLPSKIKTEYHEQDNYDNDRHKKEQGGGKLTQALTNSRNMNVKRESRSPSADSVRSSDQSNRRKTQYKEKRPVTAFDFFWQTRKNPLMKEYPGVNPKDLIKLVELEYEEMSQVEKMQYEDQSREAKEKQGSQNDAKRKRSRSQSSSRSSGSQSRSSSSGSDSGSSRSSRSSSGSSAGKQRGSRKRNNSGDTKDKEKSMPDDIPKIKSKSGETATNNFKVDQEELEYDEQ